MKINTSLINDVTVIIRAVDERSIEACQQSILTEVEKDNVHIIKEVPFSKAVQKTFEIGIASQKKWTIAIDADLILLPNTISIMIKEAKKYDDTLYFYQGFILDKFKCEIRQGGPHLYATENLKKALNLIKNDDTSLRPESDVYKKMAKLGYQVILEQKLYAVHDFFQNYGDVYRKAYFHGIKHKGWKSLIPDWLERGLKDIDYKIASIGFLDGYYAKDQVYPSINEFHVKVNYLLKDRFHIEEKGILDLNDIGSLAELTNSYGISYNEELDITRQKKPFLTRLKKKLLS